MSLTKIYLFVEGNDDELFFARIIKPMLLNMYNDVEIIKYAQMKKEKVNLFLVSIETLNFDYIFTCDIDYISSVGQKKKVIRSKFELVESEKIAVVIKEIESWYMAGVPDTFSLQNGIRIMKDTNNLTKEDFNQVYHGSYHSRIDFMIEILKVYSHELAVKKNISYKFFSKNWIEST